MVTHLENEGLIDAASSAGEQIDPKTPVRGRETLYGSAGGQRQYASVRVHSTPEEHSVDMDLESGDGERESGRVINSRRFGSYVHYEQGPIGSERRITGDEAVPHVRSLIARIAQQAPRTGH
ncbi:MAG TPA: hypothetical protein VLB73_02330 [Patescibacteria group bacterium]|jgi:hypothetical protein|nr:hypothetical protein [Patescibacteria group bacterium]